MGRCVRARARRVSACVSRRGGARWGRWGEGVGGARARVARSIGGLFALLELTPRVLAPLIARAATVWVELVAGQSLLLVLNHLVKRSQALVFVNEARWRRLQFDTRLGTYSPR